MNPPESSQISRSVSEGSTANAQSRTSANSIASMTVVLLFDQITQHIRLPNIIYIVFTIEILIQIADVSFWAAENLLYVNSDFTKELVVWVHCIATLGSKEVPGLYETNLQNINNSMILISFLIYTISFLLVAGTLAAQIVCYRMRRRFYKKTLYVTRFFLEVFPAIFILPTATFAGNMLLKLLENVNDDDNSGIRIEIIAFFVISLIENIGFTAIFFIGNSLIGYSAYLPSSFLASFDISPYISLVLVSPYFQMFSHIAVHFPSWLMHPIILLHMIFLLIMFFKYFVYRPFVSNATNGIFMFIIIYDFCMDLMNLMFFIANIFISSSSGKNSNIIGIIIIVLIVLFIIIGIIIPSIYLPIQTKKMYQSLYFSDQGVDYIPTDEEREELFTAVLNLDYNERKALMYYNFIIKYNIETYLDFFPAKFIMAKYHSNHSLSCCVRIVAYFPSQSRTLSLLNSDMLKKRDLNFKERFLCFQIQKVKLLRQSSSSSIAMTRLKELKQNSRDLEGTMQAFWAMNEKSVNINYLSQISKRLSKSKALWEESLIDFPNSIPFREEFSRFLIECETNFSGAIMQKHINDLIETGRNFNVDMCFKQFIRNFPNYLKKDILDLKGSFKKIGKKRGGGSSGSSSVNNSEGGSSGSNKYNTSNSSSMSVLDVQIEEGIGKMLMSHSRIRLALQRATENRKADSFMMYLVFSWVLFAAGLVCAIFQYVNFNGYFDNRLLNQERMKNLADTRLFTFVSTLSTFYFWGNKTNVINIDDFDSEFRKTDDPNAEVLMDLNMNWQERNSYFGVDARNSFNEFVNQIADLSEKGTDVFFYMKVLFSDTTPFSYCRDGIVTEKKKQNLKTALTYLFIATDVITADDDLPTWYAVNERWCNLLATVQDIGPSFDDLKDTIINMATNDANNAHDLLEMLQMIFTFCYIFLCLILSISSSIRFIFEINKVTEMLLKLPDFVRKSAAFPLRKDSSDEEKNSTNQHSDIQVSINDSIFFICAICIFYIAIGILLFFSYENIQYYNTQYQHLNLWTGDSLYRSPILIEICLWISQLIVSTNPYVNNNQFVDANTLNKLINTGFTNLDQMTSSLMEEGEGYPSAAGVDSEIDDILLKEDCTPNQTEASYHELYRCGSAQQLLSFFMNTVSQIQVNIKSYGGFINDEVPSSIIHISSSHLVPKFRAIDQRFIELVDIFNSQFNEKHTLFLVVLLLCCVVNIILSMMFLKYMNRCYYISLSLLRRVSPISLVADQNIVSYLLDSNKGNGNKDEMSIDQGIIHNSSSSVLCIDLNGVIDIVNPAVSDTFGFSPEQLLGQSISILIDVENRNQIMSQLELMSNMQSALTYENHTVCVTDDESKLPCAITILGMTKDGTVSSFVVLLRDVSLFLQQQEEAEKAKKASETLLFHILPRAIVVRLNQGEKDISFSVPSATIMFIDIVKFSEYASNLTPQEIMGNLSLLFAGFDEMISKHEILLKIKLIGDVYMCAGGLFSPDEPPINHAEPMIKFSLEALQVLEDTNVKLNAVLNVRIGINTGGPLIAGVLGTDKPVFDIIGDPINIAARLQSTDIPGRVQISQATYDLVGDLDFQIEQRGEVYLKGKGQQMAYLVTPMKPFAVQHSGMDSSSVHSDFNI